MDNAIPNYMDKYYNPFEQNFALAWAQAQFSAFLVSHPDAAPQEQRKIFLDALEGGLHLALDFRKQNA